MTNAREDRVDHKLDRVDRAYACLEDVSSPAEVASIMATAIYRWTHEHNIDTVRFVEAMADCCRYVSRFFP